MSSFINLVLTMKLVEKSVIVLADRTGGVNMDQINYRSTYANQSWPRYTLVSVTTRSWFRRS